MFPPRPSPQGRPRSPRGLRQGTRPQGTDADCHISAGCGPRSPGVGRPLPPRRPAGSPPSPLSLATASRGEGRHRERKTPPLPPLAGPAARGPDSSLFLSGMRGVTRPRMWRWGAGTTSPPAITSGARSSPSLSETSFPTPHGGKTKNAALWRSNRRPAPSPPTPRLDDGRRPLRPARSSPPEAGPKAWASGSTSLRPLRHFIAPFTTSPTPRQRGQHQGEGKQAVIGKIGRAHV